jgi:hypothetical protein
MRGPDHFLAGEEHLRLAEDLYRTGGDDEIVGGQLAAAIAQAHFAAATAAALAELEDNRAGDQPVLGRPYEASDRWRRVLVDDLDPELEGWRGDGT